MNAIDIRLVSDKRIYHNKIPYYKGQITIGSYSESFEISVKYWSREDYQRQWKEGLERIKTHDTSMLVTNVRNPERIPTLESPAFERWALYKVNEKIFVRPGILFNPFLDTLPYKGPFTLETWPNFITPRRTSNTKADEWSIDITDLECENVSG